MLDAGGEGRGRGAPLSLSLRRRNEGGGGRALHGNEEEEEMDRGRDAGGSWDPLPGDVCVWWRRWQGTRGEMGLGSGVAGPSAGFGWPGLRGRLGCKALFSLSLKFLKQKSIREKENEEGVRERKCARG